MLPGELELCQQFGVSRFTVREAIRALNEKGLVYRHQGIGTLVRSRQSEARYVQQMGTLTDLSHYAEKTNLIIVKKETKKIDGSTTELLKCKSGEMWLCIEGKRFTAGEELAPIALTTIYIPPAYSEIKDQIGKDTAPIYTLIENTYGESIQEVQQEIQSVSIEDKSAKILGVKAGAPGLSITRWYIGAGGKIVEVAVNIHPSERFSYKMVIRREWLGSEPK